MKTSRLFEDGAGGVPRNVRGAAVGSAGGSIMGAPLAQRESVEHVIHGDRRVDHYAWMKDKKDPRVREYLEAENTYADAEMKGTEKLQEKLYQEMLSRIQQTDLSVPYRLRGYEYYTRTEEGKQYPIYCRKRVAGDEWQVASNERSRAPLSERGSGPLSELENVNLRTKGLSDKELMEQLRAELRAGFGREKKEEGTSGSEEKTGSLALLGMTGNPEGPSVEPGLELQNSADRGRAEEEVLLDLNELTVGHTFMALGIFEVSDDNRWLAYAMDTTGYRQYVLEVKELGAHEERPASEGGPFRDELRSGFRVERVTSAAWSMDNRTLFYVTEDEVTKRSNQLWRHVFEEVASDEWPCEAQDKRVASEEKTAFHTENTEIRVSEAQREEVKTRRGDAESVKEAQRRETQDPPSQTEGGTPKTDAESRSLASLGMTVNATEDKYADLKASATTGELLYEERDERFRMDVQRSRSGAYLFLEINSHTTSEIRYLRADAPFGAFQSIAEREDEHEYYVDHHPGGARDAAGGVFFIRTNSGGRTYRLVTAPTADPGRARWHEVIANRPGVMLGGIEAFRSHLVIAEREDGLPHLRIVDLTRQAASALDGSLRLSFSEPTYSAMLGANPEFDTDFVRFQYESLVMPRTVFDYELSSEQWILKKRQPVLGDFDSGNYVSERLHAKAADGTAVPISLVRRKDTMRDGSAPLLLYAYGSYGISMPVTFNSNRLSLLDRGVMYAIAHIRGGGELGKPWHDAGRMHKKMNTFTDFIACADFFVAKRYTSEERLVIEGGSAGGLLMGAVVNLRPEKFRAVVSHVPFVDVLNTMLDPTLPLTVGEYEEWGNPEKADDYFYMKQYCPYTNVERKAYPRMLVKTAWNDSQVMYWEAAKYVAKLRAMKTDGNVLLLKTNMGAGHGGASGRYDYLREIAMDYAFMLREAGVEEVQEVKEG
jgi:protease II